MTNNLPPPAPRSVGLGTIFVVFVGCALFLGLTAWVYLRHPLTVPTHLAPEKDPADQVWQDTPEGRRNYLLQLRAKQEKQLATYAWVDRKAGVVQLPISQAEELVIGTYGPKP